MRQETFSARETVKEKDCEIAVQEANGRRTFFTREAVKEKSGEVLLFLAITHILSSFPVVKSCTLLKKLLLYKAEAAAWFPSVRKATVSAETSAQRKWLMMSLAYANKARVSFPIFNVMSVKLSLGAVAEGQIFEIRASRFGHPLNIRNPDHAVAYLP